MKKKYRFIGLNFVCFLMFSSCTPSLVYSPSVNLPPAPLSKKKIQVVGGVGWLPETRPHRIGKETAVGGEFTFRYGVSDYFTMQFKGWYDLSDNIEEKRYGLSYSNIILLNDKNSRTRFGFIPTVAFAFGGRGLEGGGGAGQLVVWLPNHHKIHPYLALGPAVGIRNLEEHPKQWGWGWVLNSGVALKLSKNIAVNLEVAGIQQINKYEGRSNFVVAPSINLSMTL